MSENTKDAQKNAPIGTDAPAWLVETLAQNEAAQQLYNLTYMMDYAYLESNEIEGPGADLERRRAAYARHVDLTGKWSKVDLALEDHFLGREIARAATQQAVAIYQRARQLEIAGYTAPSEAPTPRKKRGWHR